MVTLEEAANAIYEFREMINRGYVPPPPPPKPVEKKCEYCARPIEKCGCGANK